MDEPVYGIKEPYTKNRGGFEFWKERDIFFQPLTSSDEDEPHFSSEDLSESEIEDEWYIPRESEYQFKDQEERSGDQESSEIAAADSVNASIDNQSSENDSNDIVSSASPDPDGIVEGIRKSCMVS